MIISDFHVHYHRGYNSVVFFDSIKKNFENCLKKENLNFSQNIICLTESSGISFFNELRSAKDHSELSCWSINPTNDDNILLAKHESGFNFYIIAGRQIVARENLEILAIGMIDDLKEGEPIEDIIKFVITNGNIVIIPWGFGKWWGSRGKVVKDLIEKNIYHPLFLGDNGNRNKYIRLPSIFESARFKKIYNLQGSDSLPFKKEEERAGSFGVLIDGEIDSSNPFESFFKILTSEKIRLKNYGTLVSCQNFFKHQLGMQIVKRLRK